MMWDQRPFSSTRLRSANLKLTVDRDRIATDDFAVKVLGQSDREEALAGCGGPENHEQERI